MSGAADYYALTQNEGGGSSANAFAKVLATRLEGIGGVYDTPLSPVVDPVLKDVWEMLIACIFNVKHSQLGVINFVD